MKRLNLKLLIILLVTASVLAGSAYGVWRWQMKRNARNFLVWAEEQKQKGNLDEELNFLRRYLLLEPDDVKVQTQYALRLADAVEKQASARLYQLAIENLNKSLRSEGLSKQDRRDARERLGTLYMRGGRADDAIQQLSRLLKEEPTNSQLEKKLSECELAKGNDKRAEELLRSAIEHKPDDVNLYERLAAVYQQRYKQPEEANKILDQMVEANPQNWEAYLKRYQYRVGQGVTDAVRADIQKALELAPDNTAVLMVAAERATADKDFDLARKYLKQAQVKDPQSRDLFVALSQVERYAGNLAETTRYLEEGHKAHPRDPAILWMLAESRLRENNIEATREIITKLEKVGLVPERIDFLRALILMQTGRHADALVVFNKIRPILAATPGFDNQIDANRAVCYRAMGQVDEEVRVLEAMRVRDPLSRDIRRNLARAYMSSGKLDEAVQELHDLAAAGDRDAQLLMLTAILARNQRLPVDQRDWTESDQLIEKIVASQPDDPTMLALQVEYLSKKGDREKAKQLVDSLAEKMSDQPVYWLAQVDMATSEKGPDGGLAVLDAAEKKLGEKKEFRVPRINLLAQKGDEASLAKLQEIANKAKDLPPTEARPVLATIAQAFHGRRKMDQALALYQQMAEANPKDIASQLMIFSVQRDANDDAGMRKSIERIKELAGENNSYTLFCEAARIVSAVERKEQPASALAEAESLLEKAAQQRPNWGTLVRLRGDIAERQGAADEAIMFYERAIDLGDHNPLMLRKLVAMLLERGRRPDAERMLAKVPNASQLLGSRLESVMNFSQGNIEDALKLAQEAIAEEGESYAMQMWLGGMMKTAGKNDEAEKAFRRAVELAPDVATPYLALARFYTETAHKEEAEATIKEMESKLAPEQKTAAMASGYEIVGNTVEAEKQYLALADAKPDDLATLEQVAIFYARQRRNDKVLEFVNRIVEKSKSAKPEEQVYVDRAVRTRAELAAQSQTPAGILRAIQIIDANAKPNRPLTNEDLALKARLYAQLPDGNSRQAAIRILQDLTKNNSGRRQDQLLLAQLYDRDGKWNEAKDAMLSLVTSTETDGKPNPLFVLNYCDMLLRHDETNEVASWLARLDGTEAAKDPLYIATKARLLRGEGKTDEAIELVKSQILRPLSAQEINKLKPVADQLVGLSKDSPDAEKFLAAAEETYRELITENPADGWLYLANFQAANRTLAEAFASCDKAIEAKAPVESVARMGLVMLRGKPEQQDDKLLAQEEQWLKAATEAQPESTAVMMLVADFHDLRNQHDEAAAIYRKMLAQKDLAPGAKVAALNNLAFILAVKDNKGDEALPMVEEAIKLVGPASELLDTRGMVHLSLGKTREAIVDLENAVSSSPNAVKYFHLALANLAAGDRAAAADYFDRARNAGLTASTVPGLEIQKYEQLQKDFPPKSAASTN
jgi:tetratricopeptide (TPR) repeat protein